jgi:hypothetical protein
MKQRAVNKIKKTAKNLSQTNQKTGQIRPKLIKSQMKMGNIVTDITEIQRTVRK